MKLLRAALLSAFVFSFVLPVFAQRSGGGFRGGGGFHSGGGFRTGGVTGGGFHSGGFTGGGGFRVAPGGSVFRGGVGIGTRPGYYGYRSFGYPRYYSYPRYSYWYAPTWFGFDGFWGSYYSPYYYGSYYGSWGYPYYGYSYWNDPYYGGYSSSYVGSPGTSYYSPSYVANSSPTVNENRQPSMAYAPPSASQANSSGEPEFYLIAFKDHNIQAALSYKVEGDQIKWTTRDHVEKSAPLDSVDRRFSEQINRDRRVEFRLP